MVYRPALFRTTAGPRGAGHAEGLIVSRGIGHLQQCSTCSFEHSWRWRESNPRPSVPHQGFSGRSLLCISQPRRSRKQAADGLSRCQVSRLVPRPGQAVILLADARHRVEGIPGLTSRALIRLRRRERARAECCLSWHLLVCGHRIYEVTTATLDPLPLVQPPKSKPFTPY